MAENLMNKISHLIDQYIYILEEKGEPDEAYKYLAINTFQQNWNLDADDFYQMFRTSFSKVANLLYQNSWGFIDKAAKTFPDEVREMFRNLYDESVDISQRIETFQTESEDILPKVRQSLNRNNINAQQDERTISVYLAFRFPEKYTLYKSDYYKNFCKELNIQPKKSGECFLHLQELATQIIQEGLLDESFIKTYRKYYPKPDWNDQYLMFQNIVYVINRKDFRMMNLLEIIKNFDRKQLEDYYLFLDEIIAKFQLQEDDSKLVFNYNAKGKFIVFTIGQRYIWRVGTLKNKESVYAVISNEVFIADYSSFKGSPKAYWSLSNDIVEIINHKKNILDTIQIELNRTQKSSHLIKNNKELERMAFDIDFRNEILNQLDYQTTTEKPMESIKSNKKTPLNQILFGAPGTGKTYNTKRIAVEIINGEKARTREEINVEYENLVNANQIVFTTFHQSLSYEDFIEGIKPETIDENVTYEIKNGIFKQICISAKQNNLRVGDLIGDYKIKHIGPEIIYVKKPKAGTIVPIPKYIIAELSQLILEEKITYEDIKNTSAINAMSPSTEKYLVNGYNNLLYLLVQKINSTNKQSIPNYVIIIDEINRGNVSAIFGELITLLEEDKRKGNKEQTEVILPYSKDKFSVPNNLYIIGTMNTADRSVEALDTALRRRFSFIEMQPKPEVLLDSEYKNADLKRLLETINQRIEVLIDKDHQIGHSYFIGIQNLNDLKLVFKDKIIPLLEEYFYGDFGKIGLVLGENFIYQEENRAKFPKNFSYENDFLEDKKVYRFTPFENWDEQTFISVYED